MQAPTTTPSPARLQTRRRTTASELLAKFLPSGSVAHKMDSRNVVDLTASPSNTSRATSGAPSTSNSPPSRTLERDFDLPQDTTGSFPGRRNKDRGTNATGEVDSDTIEYSTPSRRRSLRERKPNLSLKALENSEVPRHRTRTSTRNSTSGRAAGATPGGSSPPKVSQRIAIRQDISNNSATLRSAFFIEKKDLFLPLLPDKNHVKKLLQKHEDLTEAERSKLPKVTPYEEIEVAPRGILATMKPYQLSGLSFMVYLHRNVRHFASSSTIQC